MLSLAVMISQQEDCWSFRAKQQREAKIAELKKSTASMIIPSVSWIDGNEKSCHAGKNRQHTWQDFLGGYYM